jgi:hypothetical protein
MTSNYNVQERTVSSQGTVQRESLAYSHLWWAGLLAALVAAVANLVILVVARNLLDIPVMAPAMPASAEMAPLSAIAIIIASVIPAIGATILLAVLGKFLEYPIRVFWIISVVFLLISFTSPLNLPVDIASKVTLSLMHLIAAVAIVGVLTTLPRAWTQDQAAER